MSIFLPSPLNFNSTSNSCLNEFLRICVIFEIIHHNVDISTSWGRYTIFLNYALSIWNLNIKWRSLKIVGARRAVPLMLMHVEAVQICFSVWMVSQFWLNVKDHVGLREFVERMRILYYLASFMYRIDPFRYGLACL